MTSSSLPSAADYQRLGRALRVIRRRAGLSQRALSEALEVRSEFVSACERGARALKWHKLTEWLEVCGATIGDLAKLLEADSD
jgi:transcriptional regulator with XRE-family HTH domain